MARQLKVIAPVRPPAKLIQQVHKGCGGSIVVMARCGVLSLCCRNCEMVWNFASPVMNAGLRAQDWAYQLIETFNETLRPFEKRRELIGVEIIGKSAPAHDWIKRTNGMSVEFRGALVDLFECRKCGITGKRFRLGDAVKRDSKYKAQRFANCIAEK